MKGTIIGSLVVAVGLLAIVLFYNQFNVQQIINRSMGIVSKEKTQEIAPTPIGNEDQNSRTAIATSYCNAGRKNGEVKIENFNQCVTDKMQIPLAVYKSFTGKELSKSWENLAPNEKELVVQEVQIAEKNYIQNKETQESRAAFEKAMADYEQCQKDELIKIDTWLNKQCPSSNDITDILKNMNCRSDAMASSQYKSLHTCKSPFGY